MLQNQTGIAYFPDATVSAPGKNASAQMLDSALVPDASRQERFRYATFLCAALLVIYTLPYYQNFLREETARALLLIFGGQWLLSLVLLFMGRDSLFADRAYWAAKGAIRVVQHFFRQGLEPNSGVLPQKLHLPLAEQVSLLFWIVKIFFIPFMLNVATMQMSALLPQLTYPGLAGYLLTFPGFYFFWLTFVDMIDTAIATLGYALESRSLKNTVRSVDFSLLGWLAALSCYPPFGAVLSGYFPLDTSPHVQVSSGILGIGLKTAVLILLTLFTCTTINLGFHFSNLCHRGLVTTGFYSYVRHPAYTFKLLAWILICLTHGRAMLFFSLGCWIAVYFLRALTEEWHLARVDPAYQEYCQRVRYRFIPGLV